jgi:hypothetical protein
MTHSNPFEVIAPFLSSHLDQIRNVVPPESYDVALVLVHKSMPSAHVVIGTVSPDELRRAIDDLAAKGHRIGTASVDGVNLGEVVKP